MNNASGLDVDNLIMKLIPMETSSFHVIISKTQSITFWIPYFNTRVILKKLIIQNVPDENMKFE